MIYFRSFLLSYTPQSELSRTVNVLHQLNRQYRIFMMDLRKADITNLLLYCTCQGVQRYISIYKLPTAKCHFFFF